MNIQPQQANTIIIDDRLQDFLNADNLQAMVSAWQYMQPMATKNKTEFLRAVNAEIAHIDLLLNEQLNEIIHNDTFQRLEAIWSGVIILLKAKQDEENIKIRILDAAWFEVRQDLSKSMEFDQTSLFDKIYSEEFGSPGGEPYGLIIGDYYINIQGAGSAPDLDAVHSLSHIMASAFCPFVASVTPQSFELESFAASLSFTKIAKIFDQPQYFRWQQLRKNKDSRFIALTLPKIIMRQPYDNHQQGANEFWFTENIKSDIQTNYAWGNAVFAFASVIINSFVEYNWPANFRGESTDIANNGKVTHLLSLTNTGGKEAATSLVEVLIDSLDESILSTLGFIAVCQNSTNEMPVFYSNSSIYSLQNNDIEEKISSMLQYILCASRFAHFIKMMGRNIVGSLATPKVVEAYFNNWLQSYVASNELPNNIRMRYPLQGAKIEVFEKQDGTGSFGCVIHLRPRLFLEKVNTSLKLITEFGHIKN